MAARWDWHWQNYSVSSPSTGAVLLGINDKKDIAPGSSLQRVVMRGALWGTAWYNDPNLQGAPISIGVSAGLWTETPAQGSRYFYFKYTPAVYGGGYTIAQQLGLKMYWTMSAADVVDCDAEVRHNSTAGSNALKLAFELQVLSGGELLPGTEGVCPSYHLFADLRYLTSTPT